MTSPIDPSRRAAHTGRARKSSGEHPDHSAGTEASNLPIPVGPVTRPASDAPAAGDAAIAAQLAGQTGARRGLRAGPAFIDGAKASYNRVEWSGAKDRRTPKGGAAKTEV